MTLFKTIALGAVMALGACGADQPSRGSSSQPISAAASEPGNAGGNRSATVMTRNLYIGGAVEPFFAPGVTLAQVPAMAAALWQDVQATNFAERARSIAGEIEAARPALVGLQEAALFRTQSPGDAYLPGGGQPATVVAYDFLEILLAELSARGLDYRVVQVHQNIDVELFTALGIDVRLTDRDAILVRAGVQVQDVSQGTYQVGLQLPLGGSPDHVVGVIRGWTRAQVQVQGLELVFVNTHLEPFSPIVQQYQAQELLATFAGEPRPVIMVGDFNATPQSPTYAAFAAAGYVDPFAVLHPAASGFTCCQVDDLLNATSVLYERVDHALLKGATLVPETATIVGASPADRTASGLWPSDHAGLVARVALEDPRFVSVP
jgi:Endonuclease/Exonuclease/phosphatase family